MKKTTITTFRDLEVWQQAMTLVVECYSLTDRFPASERFGLVAQLRRSCCSIPSNIAEGHNRGSTRVFLHHVNIARGSEAEFDTQVEIAIRLGFCTADSVKKLQERRAEIGRMLSGLSAALRRRSALEAAAKVSASCVVVVAGWCCASVAMLRFF